MLWRWHTYCYVRTPEPYSNGYFASLVAMARHWYKLDDHSVTYMVGRGLSAPPSRTGYRYRSFRRFSPIYVTFDFVC